MIQKQTVFKAVVIATLSVGVSLLLFLYRRSKTNEQESAANLKQENEENEAKSDRSLKNDTEEITVENKATSETDSEFENLLQPTCDLLDPNLPEPDSPEVVSPRSFDDTDFSISDNDYTGSTEDIATPSHGFETPTLPAFPYGEFYEALNSPVVLPYENIQLPASALRESLSGEFIPSSEKLPLGVNVVKEFVTPVKRRPSGLYATDVNSSIQQICDDYSEILSQPHPLTTEQSMSAMERSASSRDGNIFNGGADTIAPDGTNTSSEIIFGFHPLGSLTPNQF